MAKVRMRFTVEIPDTKENLRRMVELLNMAGVHMDGVANERAREANAIAKTMIAVLEDEPESDAIRNYRDEYIDIAKGYREAGWFVNYILTDIHYKLMDRLKE